MKTLGHARRERRGAALLMSLLVLFVLVAIVFQINVTTTTDSRVARNDVGLTTMDLAIESSLLRVFDQLAEDAKADAAAETSAGAGAGLPGAGEADEGAPEEQAGEGEPAGAPGESSSPSDSRQDEWAKPQQTSFDEMDVRLRILIQDEDAKFNVLAMAAEDEEEADLALERVTRILDLCREDTEFDIDGTRAERMARAMREYMLEREESRWPTPVLLSTSEERADLKLPLTLREFAALEPFEREDFRDFRDENGTVVHSIGSYLTVWSSPTTRSQAAGAAAGSGGGESAQGTPGEGGSTPPAEEPPPTGGEQEQPPSAGGDMAGPESLTGGLAGYAVNINTAPPAVLKGLLDDRDLSPRFWDDVIRHRNTEVEEEEEEEAEPVYDEFGEEIVRYEIFDSPSELAELDEWIELEGAVREKINELVTTQSHVFSIFITAVRQTGSEAGLLEDDPNSLSAFENRAGNQLVRTVRCVVWRRDAAEGEVEIVPIVRWEVLDYVPFEVLDDPTQRRDDFEDR